MEDSTQPIRDTNPRQKANWFSRLTFFYNYKILRKGHKNHDLNEKDIYKVLPEFEANILGNTLEAQWNFDSKNDIKLWKTLLKCFGKTYMTYTAIQLTIGTIFIILQPKAISKFVAYYQTTDSHAHSAYKDYSPFLYAMLISGLLVLNALYTHNLAQLVSEYSLKIRTAVCSLIYRKALRLRPDVFENISIGKTITLISKDVFAIDAALTFLKDMVIGILHFLVVTYLLYDRVGVTVLAGLLVIMLVVSIQVFLGKMVTKMRLKTARNADDRFKLTQEALINIKTIKMYCWQKYFERRINETRLLEIKNLAIVYYLKSAIGWFGAFSINIVLYILVLSSISDGQIMKAETFYYVQQCLQVLTIPIKVAIPMGICNFADLLAAFKRIQSFLDAEEVQPQQRLPSISPKIYLNKVKVAIKHQEILRSVSLSLNSGQILVTGNLGSGKSLLLKTILGEFPIIGGEMEVVGTMSYAPEDPWLFPGTIKQNIVFGEDYDSHRYQEVLRVCALTYDINRFEQLDNTVVGENGLNLSKGQQARITLARAIYRNKDIYLLDDCFSHLDNNVTDHIFHNCLNKFLKNKICIFVTNNPHMVTHISNSRMVFMENGSTLTLEEQLQGLDKRITYFIDDEINVLERKARQSVFIDSTIKEVDVFEEKLTDDETESENLLTLNKANKNLNIYEEKKEIGKVRWVNYSTYYKLMGGFVVMVYLLLGFFIAQFSLSYVEKIISIWVNKETEITMSQTRNSTHATDLEDISATRAYYLKMYSFLLVITMTVSLLRTYSTLHVCLQAAKKLHNRLVVALLNATMLFFDSHYVGNIINRLAKDLYVIDEVLPFLVFDLIRLFFSFISVIVLVASVNWILLIPGVLLVVKLYFIQRFYLPTGRNLRRLEASTRSPILGHLNASLKGLAIIRSSQQTSQVQKQFDQHQDLYTSASFMNLTTCRFFIFILDVIGKFFVCGILFKFIVFYAGEAAGDVGLAVSQSLMLSGILQYAFAQCTELETLMTSVERVVEYTNAKPEQTTGKAILDWPHLGEITFENVSLSYNNSNNQVLTNINLEITGAHKVGIVGRSGEGKSSLISLLFRLYDFNGVIRIDQEDIKQLQINDLRKHLTIIPEDPIFFSGTIRDNLDPFNRHSDEEIWNSLEKVHLKPLITNLLEDTKVANCCSSGQKQLLCLARAILQKNRIIILDEATACLDHETDIIVQKILRECFKDCTVLIIAHKLNSVLWCDKVVILKDGGVVEYDSPSVLLRNKRSLLRKMIREDNFETFVRLTHL